MAVATRTLLINKPAKGLLLNNKPAKPKVDLPISLSEAIHDINQYHFLVHGEKKIGKTTLLTVEERVFLLTFDPLQKALKILQRHCPDWATFMAYLEALEESAKSGRYPYKRAVVDGCDIWYRRCQDWVCKKLVIDHPNDEPFGKAWDLLKETFAGAVDRLLALPGGCWFVTHSHWREIETRQKGVQINKLLPLMKAGAEEILVGRVDGWFAYDYYETERILIVRGDERTGAGNRVRGHFMTPDGRPVIEVPMGEDEFEAWANLNAAFSNKQKYCTLAERDGVEAEPAPAPAATLLPQRRAVTSRVVVPAGARPSLLAKRPK